MESKKYHLNWDERQNNGIIFNDEYTWGAIFEGIEFKPELSFEHKGFACGNVLDNEADYYFNIEGNKKPMSPKEIEEVQEIIRNWKQAPGQEGNIKVQVTQNTETSTDNMTEGEVLTYLHILSPTDRISAMQKLADKYGLPLHNIEMYYETNKPKD